MDLSQAVFLAILQGVTEFLPISSSAHLIIPFNLFGWPDQGLAFDTAVHLGSLIAVVWYFRQDLGSLTMAVLNHWFRRTNSDEAQFAYKLVVATLPIIPVGFLLRDIIEGQLRGTTVIAIATIVFAILLMVADRRRVISGQHTDEAQNDGHDMAWHHALIIGLMQCFALIPGTSRSGITMTAALLFGYSRTMAAKFSFLLAIPAILGASLLKLSDILTAPDPVSWLPILVGTAVSAVSAYLCIRLFLGVIEKLGFMPFVIYRVLLGTTLLFIAW